jgi:hypothetical protein
VPDVKMKESRVLALKVALFYASAKGSCNDLPQSYSDRERYQHSIGQTVNVICEVEKTSPSCILYRSRNPEGAPQHSTGS